MSVMLKWVLGNPVEFIQLAEHRVELVIIIKTERQI
jgi:hypothetical protein